MASSAFTDTVDVRVVDLEAVVTREGRRLEGLSRDDFELRVDGRPVEIEYFSEIRDGVKIAEAGQTVGTHFLVFIDDVLTVGRYRNRVLQDLAAHIETLGPEDRMAIVAYDGRRIDLLAHRSRSPTDLGRALDAAQKRKSQGNLRQMIEAQPDRSLQPTRGARGRYLRPTPPGALRTAPNSPRCSIQPPPPYTPSPTPRPAAGEHRVCETTLKMRKRPHTFHISLHDAISGEALSTTFDVAL